MDKKSKTLTFSIEYANFVEQDDTFSIVELDLLHLGLNRNGSIFYKEGVENSLDSIQNKPIICIYDCNIKKLAKDYTSHATNDEQFDNIACIGLIPMKEFSNPRFVKTDDGFERLRMNGLLWSFYNETAIEILKNQKDEARVSIEIEPLETHKDENGNVVIDKFNFLGCSLLSNKVMEGMQGSKMKVLKYSVDDMIAQTDKYFSQKQQNKDIFEKIIEIKGGKMKLGHKELEQQLWTALSGEYFVRNGESYHKYYIEDIYDSHIVVRDNETEEEVKFKYNIDEEGKAHIDFTTRKVIDIQKMYRTYAKEDIGTENELKIDKDKISDDAWGGVDKAKLRERVVKAKNFKEIAPEVFLDLREGWEDGEVSKLKYPVMQIVDDTLIYNRNALASAKGYAEKNNEEEVLEKLKKIYEHLKLDFEAEDTKTMFECGKKDYEDDDIEEDEHKDEEKEDCGCEEDKDKIVMSADANVDAAAQQEMLEREADNNKELAENQNPSIVEEQDKDKIIAELTDEIARYKIEIANLTKFKTETEELQKIARMEQVFIEVGEDITDEQKNKFKEMSKEYSLETIGTWANMVKAEAFNSAKQKTNVNTFQRMDISYLQTKSKPQTNSLWDFANTDF